MAARSTRRPAREGHSKGRERREAEGVYFLSISVENMRCFGPRQTLDLSNGQGRPRQWTVILGDNGVGKTTLLQAVVAMSPVVVGMPRLVTLKTADVPAAEVEMPHTEPRAMVSSTLGGLFCDSIRYAHNEGSVQATIATGSRLSNGAHGITKYSYGFEIPRRGVESCDLIETPISGFCCFAYGATRRMGTGSLTGPGTEDATATLFEDGVPLRNAEEWLLQADYAANKDSPFKEQARRRRDDVKDMLIELLPDVEDIQFVADINNQPKRPRPGIKVKTPYGWVPLRELSLGYKTLFAWMVDLASRLYEQYPDSPNPLAEPAVVLVDVIDLHLHPRWQRTLLKYLTERFPNVQFIVTAHSPLVVQAATDAGIVVLRREGDHVVIDNEAANVKNWRIDQILTSDLFGLPSARPPELDELIERRKKLLTKARLTAKDRLELQALDERISELPGGETPEQMEAMDIIQRAARSLKTGSERK